MSEGAQKLAFLAGGLVLAVAVHVVPLLLHERQSMIVGWIGIYLGWPTVFAWALSLAKGQMEFTFFDKGLLGYYALWVLGWFVLIGLEEVPAEVWDIVVMSFGVLMPVFTVLWLLLAWMVGRERFEGPSYRVAYIPPPPPKPEPPRREPEPRPVHIRVVRPVGRVFLIRRKDRG